MSYTLADTLRAHRPQLLSCHVAGDMALVYALDGGTLQLSLLPAAAASRVVARRAEVTGDLQAQRLASPPAPVAPDCLVQLKRAGTVHTARKAAGVTLRDNRDTRQLVFQAQETSSRDGETVVLSRLQGPQGLAIEHRASWRDGAQAIRIETTVTNTGDEAVELDLLSSFSLADITPFDDGEAVERLRLHRLRNAWCSEARLESLALEALNLERTWGTHIMPTERFGQVGSMPARQFMPFLAVEDMAARVTWAADLFCAGSWQMEVQRRGDMLALSGGLADHEFGHWRKRLAPGERFSAPAARLTVVEGGLDEAAQRLSDQPGDFRAPPAEAGLPVVYNDWATGWGASDHASLLRTADRLAGTGVRYFVLDAGWFCPPGQELNERLGDWQVCGQRFPQGLGALTRELRQRDFVPGIWFEFECVAVHAAAYAETAHLLHQGGQPFTTALRRFWDFRDPWVVKRLTAQVIDFLREHGFGYLKIDYNDALGHGVDGAESPGEALRQHLEGVLAFMRAIRQALPELVIETCASGGLRLVPAFLALSDMASVSDAHESRELPLIAASLQRQLPPWQGQVWAVLRQDDDSARTLYTLAAGFLGRLCLSGDLVELPDAPWRLMQRALALYAAAAPVLRNGRSRLIASHGGSRRAPVGWQAVDRRHRDGGQALVVLHAFAAAAGSVIELPLDGPGWRVADGLWRDDEPVELTPGSLRWRPSADWTAAVVLLTRGSDG